MYAWWLGAVLAPTWLAATPLPVVLSDPIGEWKAVTLHRPVSTEFNFEMVVSHPQTKERVIVISSDPVMAPSESAINFAHQLRHAFLSDRSGSVFEQETDEMGFSGHELQFELVRENVTHACKLFAFTDEGRPWAVLWVRPNDTASFPGPRGFELLRKRLPSDDVVTLEPYRVKSNPITSYPISLEITRDRATNRIAEIVVSDVPVGSTTEQDGVRKGDFIVRINGRKVDEFAGGVDARSEIGRIFINRPSGETLELDLVAATTMRPYSVTLRSRGSSMVDKLWSNLP